MIKKIVYKLRYLIGKKKKVDPLYELGVNEPCWNSMSGGTLEGKNILVLYNSEEDYALFRDVLEQEKCYYCLHNLSSVKNREIEDEESWIEGLAGNLVGPFDVIINMIYIGAEMQLFDNNQQEIHRDGMKIFYQLNQKESNYFIRHQIMGRIVNAAIYESTEQGEIVGAVIKNMTMGLGLALGAHKVIIGGFIARSIIPRKSLMQTSIFCASRYGDILSGSVMDLK